MTSGKDREMPAVDFRQIVIRKDVLAGLLFCAIALLGLFVSRDYPVGTALRMGTGYVPRLLCWMLLALGAVVLLQGMRAAETERPQASDASAWRPLIFVSTSLVLFGLCIERLGLVVSIVLLTGVGALAARGLRFFETMVAACVLVALSWAIFILGLGLAIPVWPEW
jgi:hypothetical protein